MPEEEKPTEEKPAEEKPTGKPSKEGKKEKKEKKVVRKGKKPHKNKPTSQKWKFYKVEGEKLVRGKTCPRCGPGVFLMKAKDRLYCGRCHYTSFEKSEIEKEKKPEKKE